jgi:hypothetical protein
MREEEREREEEEVNLKKRMKNIDDNNVTR